MVYQRAIMTGLLSVSLMLTPTMSWAGSETVTVSVDFGSVVTPVASKAVSGSVSTYGENGNVITSEKQRARLKQLGLGYYRLPLQWNNGTIVSSAGGGPRDLSGDQWYDAITAAGGEPMVVVGGSKDNNFTPQDAANLVRHFSGSRKVTYWVVGNEPANGADALSIQAYCQLFNSSASAMKAVNPDIKLVGPAWAWFEYDRLKDFIDCAGSTVDVIDFHNYGSGGDYRPDSVTMMAATSTWGKQIEQLRAYVKAKFPSRASAIQFQVGETNFSWSDDDRFYRADATVWMASVVGHVLEAGGRVLQYSDLNGALGLTFEKTGDAGRYGRALFDPMPVYYGLQAFSGGSLYRGSGKTVVESSSSLPDVESYAFNDGKSLVLINKQASATQPVALKLSGYGSGNGKGTLWQTNKDLPFDAPSAKGTVAVNGGNASVTLPPYSVTIIALDEPGGGTATTTPTPSATPAITGDINGDGSVGIIDLSRLLSGWGKAGAADLNRDGKVTVIDLSILLTNWTKA